MSKKIEIYSSNFCGYCHRAKMLLEDKGIEFNEISVDNDSEKRQEMLSRSNGVTSVPQIFIEDEHIGGCDDLYALESQGLLNDKLGLAS
jgi:glutaredoxin 3